MDTSTAAEGGTYGQQPVNRSEAVSHSHDMEIGASSSPQDESKAGSPRKTAAVNRLRAHFAEEVSTAHADMLLLACCLISGFVDSTIYNAYGTFVSMQTGMLSQLSLGSIIRVS